MRVLVVVAVLPSMAYAEIDQKGVRAGGAVMALQRKDMGPSGGPSQDAINPQPGWMVGAFVTIRRSPNFAIQLETAFTQKRLRTENCAMGCVTTSEISLYYLELPFVLRLDLLPHATKFHLDLGIEGVVSLGGGDTAPGGEFERFDDLLPLNFGPLVGAGLEFGAGPGKVVIDVRYKRWLAPLNSEETTGLGATQQDVHSSHQVMASVGYAFP